MGVSPLLAETLSSNPSLLDGLLSLNFFEVLPNYETLQAEKNRFLHVSRDFEDALILLRRWANDQKFRAGVHILRHITDGDLCGPFLSDLASIVLLDVSERVFNEFSVRYGVFPGASHALIAMGKLGGRQMTMQSDLDLIVVYDVPSGVGFSNGTKSISVGEYYTKLTQRIIGSITSQTNEGRLYEVDMRLRPSGNSGPLAVSLESFSKYQHQAAWTWEHMALTRAQVLGGTSELRIKL
ncbi:(glutamine synthetase) adenylyltransferase / (glutamine synthetase)-adenylyl-L-tyrosine phosphorylase [Azospirillaceae bacterium]